MTGTLAVAPGAFFEGASLLAATILRSGGPQLTAVTSGRTASAPGEPGAAPPPGQALDRAIVCDVLARRPGAVAAAWQHFVPFVRRTLARLAGPGDLDDLTQETFERFFRKVDGLRSPDSARAFLFGIALRVAKRDRRYRWLRRDLRGSGEVDPPDAAGLDPEARAAARRLYEHLQALKPEQRSLIVARYIEEMELRDVATAHGLSFNTMRRRLERAWDVLETRLAGDELLAGYLREVSRER